MGSDGGSETIGGSEPIKDPGTRAESRDSMMMAATIRRAGPDTARVPMRVRNISAGGMMGEAEIELAAGDAVELTLNKVGDVEGVVAWADDGRFGIAFRVLVDKLRVRRSISVKTDRQKPEQPQSRRPGLRIV